MAKIAVAMPSLHIQLPSRPLSLLLRVDHCPQMGNSNCVFSPSLILPNLYLGNYDDALCVDAITERGIRHVLNVSAECDFPPELERRCRTWRIPIDDHSDAPIHEYFEAASAFIREALDRREGVLVHCRMGLSRSATIVIAFLMRHGHEYGLSPSTPVSTAITYRDALSFVRRKRSQVSPNIGFILALRGYEVLPPAVGSGAAYSHYTSVVDAGGSDDGGRVGLGVDGNDVVVSDEDGLEDCFGCAFSPSPMIDAASSNFDDSVW